MAGNTERVEAVLTYPGHYHGVVFRPEDLLSFIISKEFESSWVECGMNDEDMWELQGVIMCNPIIHPVIDGTGGLRKVRFVPTRLMKEVQKVGKYETHCAFYVYYEAYGIIFLVIASQTDGDAEFSSEGKRAMRTMIEQQEKLLARGPLT